MAQPMALALATPRLPCACGDQSSLYKLALPEVKLGLLPWRRRHRRLPRLVGIQKALNMMLTGKNIFARPAQKMGLVDVFTDHHKLHTVAVQLCQRDGQRKVAT